MGTYSKNKYLLNHFCILPIIASDFGDEKQITIWSNHILSQLSG